MWLEFIGDTLDFFGKVLIAMTALAVHDRFREEHKFDEKVSKTIRKEHVYAALGILLMAAGFIFKQLGHHSQ